MRPQFDLQKTEAILRLMGLSLQIAGAYFLYREFEGGLGRWAFLFISIVWAGVICTFVDSLVRYKFRVRSSFAISGNPLVRQGVIWVSGLLVAGYFVEARLPLKSNAHHVVYASVVYFWVCALFGVFKYFRRAI